MDSIGRIELPFKLFKRGKVRDVFTVADNLLIVASDRISCFDYVLPSLIPGKGRILNQISLFWFDYTQRWIPNHVLCAAPEKLPEFAAHAAILAKRSVLAKKVAVFPVEAVVRGYLVGSGWQSYQKEGKICGIPLPPGLKIADRFPEPLFTPTTKAETGHDEPITFGDLADTIGQAEATAIRDLSMQLFAQASTLAQEKEILIADSKFEFGRDENGRIILVDEIFTPDSSRFWKKGDYRSGVEPPAYDKQFVRNYLLNSPWDRNSPPPELPAEIVAKTAVLYEDIYQLLTN